MERAIAVAVVGCGWAGTRHAHAFRRQGALLRWAVDTRQERAAALAAGAEETRVAADFRTALEDPAVDAVTICLPHHLHAPVTVAAAQAGKHVLCEKPLAASLTEADRMIAAARDAGVMLMVAENVHFDPLYHEMRRLLDAGAIGRPALIQMTRECYLTRSFLEDRRWFLDRRAAAGGIMMSGGIHDFEAMRLLIGEVAGVSALRARQRFAEMEGDDTSIAQVRFVDGTVGTLVESFVMKSLITASGPEVHTVRIDGELGSLAVRDGHTIRLFSERPEYLPGGVLTQHDLYVPETDTFEREIAHFLTCLRSGEEPRSSGRSQRRPLEIVLAAYASMESGAPVTLAPPA
jgi:predicted dehydrogenase